MALTCASCVHRRRAGRSGALPLAAGGEQEAGTGCEHVVQLAALGRRPLGLHRAAWAADSLQDQPREGRGQPGLLWWGGSGRAGTGTRPRAAAPRAAAVELRLGAATRQLADFPPPAAPRSPMPTTGPPPTAAFEPPTWTTRSPRFVPPPSGPAGSPIYPPRSTLVLKMGMRCQDEASGCSVSCSQIFRKKSCV